MALFYTMPEMILNSQPDTYVGVISLVLQINELAALLFKRLA
jgi:hypothetical protein